jgi:RimJ/RimL family protein N-acetyltransferase
MAFKPGFAPILETARLNLIHFDVSNPTNLELNLRLLYDPAFQADFGDYGLTTQDDVYRLWASTLIKPTTCPKLLDKPSAAGYIMCLKPDHENLYSTATGSDPAAAFASASGKMLGLVTLASRSASLPPDMGWGLWQEYANKGFATEAGREALRYWRDECEIREIIAWPKETNIPSVRTAAKLGFVENGVIFDADKGVRHACYMLPGMKRFEEGTRISFFGEEEEKTSV